LLSELAQALREFHSLSASFYRSAAARAGLTVTDLEVIDILSRAGPLTAGPLAELTGLTTGAITGMLNRLEEGGRVRRERDPNDGRRVIVRLAGSGSDGSGSAPTAFLGKTWQELASQYNDEQLTLLLDFMQRANALSQQELARLQAGPEQAEQTFSAPRGNLTHAQLVLAGTTRLTVTADERLADLYWLNFEGRPPEVKALNGVVTIRYPRRLWLPGVKARAAEVRLNAAVAWQIVLQGGASDITADLTHLNLTGLEARGGMSMIRLQLPAPTSLVPIRISGGASEVTLGRPAGVPARVHLKGWASSFVFDEQSYNYLGNDVRLQSPTYDGVAPSYDIEVDSSVSGITITAG
jgi:DNA-binding MarR family transcriptional regulator